MLKNKGIILVVIMSMILIGGTSAFSVRNKATSKITLERGGFILDGTENKADGYCKYYFEEDTTFEYRYPDSIVFHDTENQTAIADTTSFIHYSDGSIASFSQGVITDLNNISGSVLNYFRLSCDNIMELSGNSYMLDYQDTSNYFSDFLWKIADNKYLIASKEIKIQFSNQDTRVYANYVELQYYNEGILLILSDEGAYRSVSSDCIATLSNGVQLDLAKRIILSEESVCLSMEQLVLDTDDSIDVLAPIKSSSQKANDSVDIKIPTFEVIDGTDGEAGEAGENGKQGETGIAGEDGEDGEEGKEGIDGLSGEDGSSGNPGNPGDPGTSGTTGVSGVNGVNGANGSGGASGAAGANGKNGNDGQSGDDLIAGDVAENPGDDSDIDFHMPVFELISLASTSNSVNGQIRVTDEDAILDSQTEILVKIVENIDGKEVARSGFTTDQYLLDYQFDSLKSDTEYRLMVTANYIVNSKSYEKIFLSKTFMTDSIGLTFELQSRTDSSLGFTVKKKAYSYVIAADLQLLDLSGNIITTVEIDMNDAATSSGVGVVFSNSVSTPIASNTTYKVQLCNIQYDSLLNIGMTSSYGKTECQTLKKKPNLGLPLVVVNKVDGVFDMQLQTVSDVDKGIVSYRYELYECDRYGTMVSQTPTKSISISQNTVVPCNVDGVTILRNRYYRIRVVATFYDNEKQVEYASEYSDVFGMAGTNYPYVEFRKDDVATHHDRIVGNIVLHTNGAIVTASAQNPLIVQYTSSKGIVKHISYNRLDHLTLTGESDTAYAIPFDQGNLLADDNYIISVYGMVDLNDGAGAEKGLLGSVVVQTDVPNAFRAVINQTSDASAQMSFSMSLVDADPSTSSSYEASTLEYLQVNVYNGDETAMLNSSPIASYALNGDNGENYASTLASLVYGANFVELNENTLGVSMASITASEYTIEVTLASDYTEYANEFKIIDNVKTLPKIAAPPSLDTIDVNDGLTLVPIINANASRYAGYGASYNNSLPADTIIGYEVKAKYDNSSKLVKNFIYYVYEQAQYPQSANAADFYLGEQNVLTKKTVAVANDSAVFEGAVFLFDQEPNLTRGSKYVFTYRAELTSTSTYFPECLNPAVVIRSTTAETPYITPKFYVIPWKSDSNSIQYKYYVDAPDSAAVSENFTNSTGTISNKAIIKNVKGQLLEINALIKGRTLEVSCDMNLYKQVYYASSSRKMILIKQYFEGIYDASIISNKVTYSCEVEQEANRIVFTLKDALDNMANMKRVVALKVEIYDAVHTLRKTLTLPITIITGNSADLYLNYAQIEDLLGNTLYLKTFVLYDNGTTGYELIESASKDCAIQVMTQTSATKYVALNYAHDNIAVNSTDEAKGSYFRINQASLTWPSFSIKASSLIDTNYSNVSYSLQAGAIGPRLSALADNDIVTLKGISSQMIKNKQPSDASGQDMFEFNFISMLPTINLNRGDAYTIVTMSDSAKVSWKLNGQHSVLSAHDVRGNLMYFDLYEISDTNTRSLLQEGVASTTISDSITEYETTISNLVPNKKYGITIYYIDDHTGDKVYPIDSNRPSTTGNAIMFVFTTSDEIVITPSNAYISSSTYKDKQINIPYTVNNTLGYRILFTLYQKVGDSYQVIKSSSELSAEGIIRTPNVMFENMTATIKFSPGLISWQDGGNALYLPFNSNEYFLGMKPVSSSDNMTLLGTEVYASLNISELKTPYYNITSIPLTASSIRYRISIVDVDNVMVENQYKVKIMDNTGTDVTPSSVRNVVFSSLTPRTIDVEGLAADKSYSIKLYTVLDIQNTGLVPKIQDVDYGNLNATYLVKSYTASTLADKGYNIGEVSVVASPGNMVKLFFKDSVNLESRIRYIQYTIVTPSGSYRTYTDTFTLHVLDDTRKYFELSHLFSEIGDYVIQVRFFDENKDNMNEDLSLSYYKEY